MTVIVPFDSTAIRPPPTAASACAAGPRFTTLPPTRHDADETLPGDDQGRAVAPLPVGNVTCDRPAVVRKQRPAAEQFAEPTASRVAAGAVAVRRELDLPWLPSGELCRSDDELEIVSAALLQPADLSAAERDLRHPVPDTPVSEAARGSSWSRPDNDPDRTARPIPRCHDRSAPAVTGERPDRRPRREDRISTARKAAARADCRRRRRAPQDCEPVFAAAFHDLADRDDEIGLPVPVHVAGGEVESAVRERRQRERRVDGRAQATPAVAEEQRHRAAVIAECKVELLVGVQIRRHRLGRPELAFHDQSRSGREPAGACAQQHGRLVRRSTRGSGRDGKIGLGIAVEVSDRLQARVQRWRCCESRPTPSPARISILLGSVVETARSGLPSPLNSATVTRPGPDR